MLLLAIDTTLGACSAAIHDAGGSEGRTLAARYLEMARGHAEALAPMVAECLEEAGVKPASLDRIAVTRGPGTFTGIRIGLAMAHGMGSALKLPVVGISTLKAIAAPFAARDATVLIVNEAPGTELYHAQFFASGGLLNASDGDLRLAPLAQCVAMLESVSGVAGTGAVAVNAAAGPHAKPVLGHRFPVAADFASFAATLPVSGALPQPLYLRDPGATPASPVAQVRPVALDDLPAITHLHARSFDKPWNMESLARGLALPGARGLVAEAHGLIRAFLQYQVTADEAEIITLCTLPSFRNAGLATALVAKMKEDAQGEGATKIFLEVAAANDGARGLYIRSGFAPSGRRKGYYVKDGGTAEDAVMMVCALE